MSPPPPSLLDVLSAVIYYVGLALPIGIGMTLSALVIPESRGGTVAARLRTAVVPAAVLVALAGGWHFAQATSRSGALKLDAIGQFGLFAVTVAGLLAMRASRARWLSAGVMLTAAAAAVLPDLPHSLSAVRGFAHNGITIVHLLGALFWVGGLITLAIAGLLGRGGSHTPDATADDWSQIWERFSLVALYAVGAVFVSGVWLSWIHVGTVGQLITTSYGRALAVKLILVLALLATGAYNVRVLLPRIRASRRAGDRRSVIALAAQHFPVVVGVEALIAVGVLFVVPFLRGSARSAAGSPAARSFDLTTFGVGVVLVALTAGALWAANRTSAGGDT